MGIKYSATYGGRTEEVTDANGSSFVLKYGGKDSGGNDHIIQQETISSGSGKTLSCSGKLMLGDVKVGSIKTLSCGGKIAASDINVASQSYTPNVTLTITGSGSSWAVIVVNGTEYRSAATVTMAKGTTITLAVSGTSIYNGEIHINGSRVVKTSGTQSCTFTMNSNASAVLNYQNSGLFKKYGTIDLSGGT